MGATTRQLHAGAAREQEQANKRATFNNDFEHNSQPTHREDELVVVAVGLTM